MSVTLTSIGCLPSCPNLAVLLVAVVIHNNDARWTPFGNRSALGLLPDRRGSKESGLQKGCGSVVRCPSDRWARAAGQLPWRASESVCRSATNPVALVLAQFLGAGDLRGRRR